MKHPVKYFRNISGQKISRSFTADCMLLMVSVKECAWLISQCWSVWDVFHWSTTFAGYWLGVC